MPAVASMAGGSGFGRAAVVIASSDPAIISGNATTTMSTTGFTQIIGLTGVDDNAANIPTNASFNFNFFGTNYGLANTNGIYWSSNNVLGFGSANATINWSANTGRGILLGNRDRRCTTCWYSPMTTSGTSQIMSILASFQNYYSAGSANEGQMQIRLIRSSTKQYIEVRVYKGSGGANGGAITTTGTWNLTDNTTFQGTFGSTFNTTFPADNTSFVLSSDLAGNTWTFSASSYVGI
jgi:hypothetical protein